MSNKQIVGVIVLGAFLVLKAIEGYEIYKDHKNHNNRPRKNISREESA